MVNIRNVNDIILSLIDFFKLAQPDLDTKPGSVARDLFIDAPASQLSLLYSELSNISNKSSLRLVTGSDLDKLGKNFAVIRKQATTSSGVALLTFSSLQAPVPITKGSLVISSNGFAFSVNSSVSVNSANSNFYRSIASKYRNELDTAGISDEYAVEVSVTSTTTGISGNIGKFSLKRTNIPGVSNVTNVLAFTGGSDQESDSVFRNRILSVFSGSSIGTALGYQNVAFGTNGVIDATVVEPGDDLMTRDGTVTQKNSDGTMTILSEGSGGKVDVVVLGNSLVENVDSFIYVDKSNSNDPTSSKNDVVLGQISGDENKTILKKRKDNIKKGTLPAQPVESLTEVSGSLSGSNFVEKTTDQYGRVSGNYELVKDTGVYQGSLWGFDKFHWISDKVSDYSEDRVKGQLNGQDSTSFSDVMEINKIQQNVLITNENSIVTSDRSIIQLLHYPVSSVTRVFNVNTGERYFIKDQNPDSDEILNPTGRIVISGNTLPTSSDVLQVDYNWVVYFDKYNDFDGLYNTDNKRTVNDSIDWGYSNLVRNERLRFSLTDTSFSATSSFPISTVVSCKKFKDVDGYVSKITEGIYVDRLAVIITNLAEETTSVDSVKLKNSIDEIYNTSQSNQDFISETIVVGIELLYKTTIILPTDTIAQENDRANVYLNATDVFTVDNISGTGSSFTITIPEGNVDTTNSEIDLLVTYIANVSEMYNSGTTSLPSSKVANGFLLNSSLGNVTNSIVNTSKYENQIVKQNLSLQYYIDISIQASEFNIDSVLSVVRLSDGLELWNSENVGTVITGTSGNYQLIFNGYNSPVTGDRVLAFYYPKDIKRFQPFSYTNKVIAKRIDSLENEPSLDRFVLDLNKFTSENFSFEIIDPTSDSVLVSITDGYIVDNGSYADISSYSFNFDGYVDLLQYKINVSSNASSNNGTYDIFEYNESTNKISIKNYYDSIDYNQVSVIRLSDGKDLWTSSGDIDIDNNRIILPEGANALENDKVLLVCFTYNSLRKSPTRLISSISDQVINPGTLVVSGNTINKAEDIVFTATSSSLKVNINEAIRTALSLSSVTAIPTNIKLINVVKLEKVNVVSSSSNEVLSVKNSFDLKNIKLKENVYYDTLLDSSLGNMDFVLSSTDNNNSYMPEIGDKLRITFYYVVEGDTESLAYTRNGVLYTNKVFGIVDKIFISSGFKNSLSTRLTMSSFTQPALNARYKVFYDYAAPKQNERIYIKYNYNKLISDVTFNIENNRPINADVLVRGAKPILLDLVINVVISTTTSLSSSTIIQNLKDAMITTLTVNKLGQTVDQVTIRNNAESVTGIDRVRILYFNKTGEDGTVLKVQAQKDEYFLSNNITINKESR